MHALEHLIEAGLGLIAFGLAVVLLLSKAKSLTQLSETVKNRISENDIGYVSSVISEEPEVSYAQLIASLSDRIGYDVYIDGVIISAGTYTPAQLSAYPIPKHAFYTKEINFNSDGSVESVVYRGK